LVKGDLLFPVCVLFHGLADLSAYGLGNSSGTVEQEIAHTNDFRQFAKRFFLELASPVAVHGVFPLPVAVRLGYYFFCNRRATEPKTAACLKTIGMQSQRLVGRRAEKYNDFQTAHLGDRHMLPCLKIN